MPTPSQYLAITIGPVVKTLLQVRKTRELWAASYLLSSLMKHLVRQLDPQGQHLLIPRIPTSLNAKPLYGAGIYPDRLFMEADHLDSLQVQTAITGALDGLLTDLGTAKAELDKNRPFWEQFFRIRFVLLPLASIQNGDLSLQLSPILDSLELEDTCFPEMPEPNRFLDALQGFFNLPMTQELKGKTNRGNYDSILNGRAVFPSTSDIATFDLYEKHGDIIQKVKQKYYDEIEENHEQLYLQLEADEQLKSVLRPRHKYFCIVQADGDSVGAAIQQLQDRADYIRFSETLAEYGADAAELINQYGGKPIYIGGDDLLFLAPLQSSKGSVFDLIAELRNTFPAKKLDPSGKVQPAPSLSFGINIVYYKYPLFEAIGEAYGLLKKAKNHTNVAGAEKNSICFQFTKHSGSKFSAVFSQAFFEAMLKSVKTFSKTSVGSREGLVSSLIYKLFTLKKLLNDLSSNVQRQKEKGVAIDLSQRLEETFDHFYNEWDKHPDFDRQKKAIIQLLLAAQEELGAANKWLQLCYTTLRLVQFMIASPEKQLNHDPENIAEAAA